MKKPMVGIVTFPIEEAGYAPLVNLINAVTPSCQTVCVITGGAGLRLTGQHGLTVREVSHNPGKGRMKRVLRFLYTQIRSPNEYLNPEKKWTNLSSSLVVTCCPSR